MGTSVAATSVTSTGGGAGAWFCARVEQPAAAQRAARTAAQTDSESRLLLIVGLMLWLLRECCVILYCARKAGAVAKRRLRTSVFREPPRFAFDNAARSPWDVARCLGGALRLRGLPEHPERRRDPIPVQRPRREGPARGRGLRGETGSFRRGYKWFQFVRVGPLKWLRLVILPAGLSAVRIPRPRVAQRAPRGVPPGPDSAGTGTNCWTCSPCGGSLRPAGSCGSGRA